MNANAHWLDERRADAANRFAALGVPHRRIEDWKYSDLKTALGDDGFDGGTPFGMVTVPRGVENYESDDPAPHWFEAHYGKIGPQNFLSDASLASERGIIALRVPKGAQVADPILFDWSGSGQKRVLLVVEDGASVSLKESVAARGAMNIGMEFVLGEGATLRHVRRSAHRESAVAMENIAVKEAANAVYRAHYFTTGSRLSRTEVHIALEGKGAAAHLSGVSVLGGTAHADVTTHITHAVGHTTSTQLFKHIAGGKSRAVYQGRITVEQGADKSDSRQTAKALLMGERAEADLKPELEIFADDVKCAHGAAVGDLDPNSLFYLRARGIPEAEARNMLVRAFLEEAVDEIADEAIRATVWQAVEDALPGAMAP